MNLILVWKLHIQMMLSKSFNFDRYEDNAVQRVIVSKPNVKILELAFQWNSSAVTEITYCRVCEAKEGHDESHSCVVAGNVVNKVSEEIERNNFEELNIVDALNGWENGIIQNGNGSVVFTKFLGNPTRYFQSLLMLKR